LDACQASISQSSVFPLVSLETIPYKLGSKASTFLPL
jgi:hypothetical protein